MDLFQVLSGAQQRPGTATPGFSQNIGIADSTSSIFQTGKTGESLEQSFAELLESLADLQTKRIEPSAKTVVDQPDDLLDSTSQEFSGSDLTQERTNETTPKVSVQRAIGKSVTLEVAAVTTYQPEVKTALQSVDRRISDQNLSPQLDAGETVSNRGILTGKPAETKPEWVQRPILLFQNGESSNSTSEVDKPETSVPLTKKQERGTTSKLQVSESVVSPRFDSFTTRSPEKLQEVTSAGETKPQVIDLVSQRAHADNRHRGVKPVNLETLANFETTSHVDPDQANGRSRYRLADQKSEPLHPQLVRTQLFPSQRI